jgi:hypothetical protein
MAMISIRDWGSPPHFPYQQQTSDITASAAPTRDHHRLRVGPELAGQLEGFNIVDVSIEPYDGNPAHSRNSQVCGVLPPKAGAST